MSRLINKHPDEAYAVPIDFSGEDRLPDSVTIVSGLASAINGKTSADATNDILSDTVIEIVGGNLGKVGLSGGEEGNTYAITCLFTLSNSEILAEVFQVRVTLDP